MRPVAVLVALIAGLMASGCLGEDTLGPTHAGTYSGAVRSADCRSNWFTGKDDTARYTCTADGYELGLDRRGQAASVTLVDQAALMRVDAVVQMLSPGPGHPNADPGVACFWDRRFGWLAEISDDSRWYIVPYGQRTPLAKGASPAIRPLTQQNHLVLTCDATGSDTRISLSVNGKLVARDVKAAAVIRLRSFGVWTAGEAGATLRVSRITGTTR